MGKDDKNEGGEGECPGHEWVMTHVDLNSHGGYIYSSCKWCGTVSVEQP